ncbi:MAG: CaiB/BaiF CoA transferase family protein [Dehalococcoidia bacterium]
MNALAGLTVLDLSGTVATALCTKLFADFGARVVNIESPRGHPTRSLPPHLPGARPGEGSGIHAILSPHKESAVIDLESATGRGELLEWVRFADVAIEAAGPGVLERSSIGFETLRARSSGLVLCSLSWWGATGPFAGFPANDQMLQCSIGQVHGLGPVEGPPMLPSGYPVQIVGGLTAFDAIMVHLTGDLRGRGRPAHIDVSLFEAAMALTETGPPASTMSDLRPPRTGLNRFVPTHPASIYETADGWLGVTALTPKQWHDLCEMAGVEDLPKDPELDVTINRLLQADRVDAALVPAFRKRTADEWFHEGQARRIPLALVPTMADLFESEQLRALDAFRTVSSPALGELEVPAEPFRLHGTPALKDGPVAALGEHRPPAPDPGRPAPATGARDTIPGRPPPVRPPNARPMTLDGLRVIDLTMGWAGPLAARHLADAGAEVIKVESPTRFDWWRGWDLTPDRIAERAYELAPNFNVMQRNKLGISLDLTRSEGNDLIRRLIAVSDVVIENFSAGVMPGLGLEWSAIREINPRIVMLSMPPFGAGGPWQSYRAYGSTVEQASGTPHLHGSPDQPPVMTHVSIGDPVAGIHAAAALLIALYHQGRTGEGQLVDMSQVQASVWLGLHGIAHQVLLGRPPERTGNRHPVHAPQGVYPCAGEERWLALTVESDEAWTRLVELTGDARLETRTLRTVEGRRSAHDLIDEAISEWTVARDRDEAVLKLLRAGIPAAATLIAPEVLSHPQLEAREYWQWIERPYAGVLPHGVAPYRTGGAPFPIDFPAPTLGQDTREVLGSLLGLGEAELDRLEREGIIGEEPMPA